MSENDTQDDETQPVRPEAPADLPPAPATTTEETAAPAATARRGFRQRFRSLRSSDGNRTYGLAALIASALAGIIVGGLSGMAFHAAVDDDGPDRGVFRHGPGPWDRDFGERPGPPRDFYREAPPGFPGEVPPTTTPDDEDSSPGESPSDQSSS